MKVLIDMNLSPDWVQTLLSADIETVHWSMVGKATATDETILRFAADHGFIVLTHDLDFGIALASLETRSRVCFRFVRTSCCLAN